MCKKILTKIVLVSLLLVALCFVASCGKKESKKETLDEAGTVHLLNGFEEVSDLYSFKPTVTHTVATMDIVGKDAGQVKEGNASLKYDFQKGIWPEILLYVKQSSYPKLDISNLNKVNVSVYNDTAQPVEATLSVIVSGKVTLLSERYTLEANTWNDLDFRLSALACKYNEDKIVGFSLRMEADEAAVFYIDNWTATMGAENTDEDNKWEPLLNDIIERIDNLPNEIALSDGEELEALYKDYASLPDLYRNIIPNYDVLREAIAAYAELKITSEEEGLETRFLVFDEFYGIGQIQNDVNGAYPILYQTDVKYGDEAGSIMITFDGSTQESYFAYTTPLDAALYDYVEMSFYNDDIYRKVIYFNWNQHIVVEPNTWGTIKIPGEEFRSTGRIIVDTINEYGTRINSSGKVYFSALRGTRRDLLTELQKLPNASDFVMPRDIKYLTLIEKTMELYNKLPDSAKTNIPEELITNLERCYAKIDGYRTVFDTTTEDIQFGTPDCKSVGEAIAGTDEQYGPIFTLKYTEAAAGDYAAGFQFNKDFSDAKNMFFYIYNPKNTAQIMYLYADGNWKDLGARTLEPGWNEIQLPSDINVSSFIFGLFPKTADVVGEWKVTSIYEVANEIIDTEEASDVKALIEALPDASTISMPRDLRYVTAISAAKEAYDALSTAAKAKIPASLKNKLDACLAATQGYSAVINAITDDMTVGTPDCVCSGTLNRKTDSEYGPVFGLNITGAGTGDYAAGFQVNKDISDSENIFFYIYNPQDSAQNLYLYADPSWKDLGPRVVNPGWNKVELPNDKKIEQYVFGLFPKGSDVVGEWKITSFYSMSDAAVAKEEALETAAMIDALPNADAITLPDDLKYVALIDEALTAYEALSDEAKAQISDAQKEKLDALSDKIKYYEVVVNARTDEMTVGTPDCVCKGTLDRETDETYGPVFGLNITENATVNYAGGFQVYKDLSAHKNMFFYIYNPTGEVQTMWMYADPSWKGVGDKTLEPGWNLVELALSDANMIEQYVFGLFPLGSDVTGEWKISSFYEVADEEAIKAVKQAIIALPSPNVLTVEDGAKVENVKALYDALSDKEKSYLTAEEVAKLEACIAKIPELEMQAVGSMIDALPDAEDIVTEANIMKNYAEIQKVKGLYDALSEEGKGLITEEQKAKLDACVAKLANYTLLVDASDVTMTHQPDCNCESEFTAGTDATYGSVVEINITKAGTINSYIGCFQIETDLSGNDEVFFWLYNPLSESQVMWLYADNWEQAGGGRMEPGWNRVSVTGEVNGRIYGLITTGTGVGTWKVSSIFAGSGASTVEPNPEAIRAVKQAIIAMPWADELTTQDILTVENVKALYDGLNDLEKTYLTSEEVEKLNACVAKLPDLYAKIVVDKIAALPEADALTLEDKEAVEAAKAAYDALDTEIQAKVTNLDKLNACLAKLAELEPPSNVIPYSSTSNHRFDYYNNETNAAYAVAALEDVEVAGQTAKWSATVNVTQQNGGFARAYQGLELTVDELKAYKEAGYTHLRIPYYLEAPADVDIYVHSDGWEWNYKKAADAVRGAWTNFDYPIDDLLLVPNTATGNTVLAGINTASGAFGIINIGVNATGTYKLYLGECEMIKPEEKQDAIVAFTSTQNHRFDYYNDETNAAYAEATLGDVEVAGQTAKWSATVNVTQQNGGFARAYQALELTVDDLKAYKEAGYTHLRIPYYLEAPADVDIYVHSDGWEWNYKKAADAVRGAWTNFDYPIDDLLLVPNTATGTTVLEGINTAKGAYGLININVNATGTYKLYLGTCSLIAK